MALLRNLMVSEMVTARPEQTVLEVAALMCQNRVGAVLVVDNGELLGLFSERDLLNRVIGEKRDPATTKVGQVSTGSLATIDVEQPLKEVLAIFRRQRFRHLPVMEGSKPVGILSTRDLLTYVVDGFERYIDQLKYQRQLNEGVDVYDHLGGSYGR